MHKGAKKRVIFLAPLCVCSLYFTLPEAELSIACLLDN